MLAGAMSAKRELLCTATRLIRLPEVEQRTGLTRDQITAEEIAGRFPQRVSLTNRAVGWVESEVDRWIAERIALRMDPARSEQLKILRAPPPARQRMQARHERVHEPDTSGPI
jgi:prophage regulatory protein